ncbi:NAD(P)H-binding protein [Kribbella sp. NPDC005582]|uniref:NAD(P)H-binding protein n=1 Tax=Kribbella sp. NPDC005582 TaxID=3156893 RepID=UPI0033B04CD4
MIVVTGATGNVGRPLVEALKAAGEQVTAVSRRAADHPGDLSQPETLKPALDGADAVFLMTPPDFLANGDLGAVLDVVRGAGVQRVVLLSSQGVGTQRHPSYLEDAVTASGLEWTILRPGNFASNAFQWAESVRTRRVVEAPYGDVLLPAVDPADIAEVAAAALRGADHGGQIYTLTGPEPIGPRGMAAAIGETIGVPVEFVELTREEALNRMLGYMPEPVVEATLGAIGSPTADEQAVSPDISQVLGRPARTFADWARRNAAAFA